MKLLLLAIASWILTSCTVNRYYYVAEEPIELYEFPSFSGEPVLTVSIGDTVAATGTNSIGLGNQIPVEFKGHRFYSPSAKARFVRIARVHKRREAAVTGLAYAPRMRVKTPSVNLEVSEGNSGEWYGQVTYSVPVLKEPFAISKTVTSLPGNSIVKIRQHDYNYWEVEVNGKKGYISAFSILD